MKTQKKTKYVHEGKYVAEVDVEIVLDETLWSPYLRLEDANRLDKVRQALRESDFALAAEYGRIYELQPL